MEKYKFTLIIACNFIFFYIKLEFINASYSGGMGNPILNVQFF